MTAGVSGSASSRQANGARIAPEVFEEVVGHSVDGVFIGVPDGRILYANPAACDIFRASEDELRHLGRQGISNPDDPLWQATLAERARTGRVRATVPMTRLDGTPFLSELTSAIFPHEGGELITCVIVRDVTERVHMERRLVAYEDVAEALLARADIPSVLPLLARHARSIFDADVAVITAPDGGEGMVVAAADGPATDRLVGRTYSPGGLGDEVLAAKQAVLVEDLSATARSEDDRSLAVGPAMAAPIVSDEHVFGVLLVGSRRGRHPYGVADLREASEFARRAAVALALGQERAETERQQRRTAEQLQRALDSRVVIEQAKGFIAAVRHIGTEEAFDRIRRYARSHNANIHDVARAVIDRDLLP